MGRVIWESDSYCCFGVQLGFRGGAMGVQKLEEAPESSRAVSLGWIDGSHTSVCGAWVGLGGVVVGLRLGLGFGLGAALGLQLGVCVGTCIGVKYVAKLVFANKILLLPLGPKILTPHRQPPCLFPVLGGHVSQPKLTLLPKSWHPDCSLVPLVASFLWQGHRSWQVTLE